MPKPIHSAGRVRSVAVLGLALWGLSNLAAAGDLRWPSSTPKSYVQACGECHAVYPPTLLPPVSWQKLMGGLDRHFGVDASIDAASAREIQDWLARETARGTQVRERPPEDRLTRSSWFIRHHDEVGKDVWALPSVKSPANCAACHVSADRGVFSEHDLKAPAGMTAAQKRRWRDD